MAPLALDSMFPADLSEVGGFARDLEDAGFDGMWTNETPHDPYLPLAVAAPATARMVLGTGIATAFTRSPMVTALAAWDLLKAAVRMEDVDAMVAAIDDDVLSQFAIVADVWTDAAAVVGERYEGVLDRVGFYGLGGLVRPVEASPIARAFGRG